MITKLHPAVRALDLLPYECFLVGSRGLGLHRETSDHDYLMAAPPGYAWDPAYLAMKEALVAAGFRHDDSGKGYGPDPSAEVWTCPAADGWPDVDVIVVSRAEYDLRIRALAAMRKATRGVEEMGRLYRGLKAEKAWPLFWATLRSIAVKTTP